MCILFYFVVLALQGNGRFNKGQIEKPANLGFYFVIFVDGGGRELKK